ncbi:UNVERIFIED_CONTAM: hypothetical protein PYX00_003089 [Menopon gallinae]|uniref:trypsin n=1 Tax=Menopon gallinae TaxID=328185 RepID=A0AAW2HZ24_9NEOP
MHLRILFAILLGCACAAQDYGSDGKFLRARRDVVLGPVPSGHQFRVVAGRMADIDEFPYQAVIERPGRTHCGASVIAPRVLLTAAHCLNPVWGKPTISEKEMWVRLGSNTSLVGGRVYHIERAVPHEKYKPKSSDDEYDIALIFLKEQIAFGPNVKMIRLPTRPAKVGDLAYVTGYGRQELRSSDQMRQLMAIEIPILKNKVCNEIIKIFNKQISDTLLCAGRKTGHADACLGDSGGPMVVDDVIVGITASGFGCGRQGIPGIYTRVFEYLNWIKENSGVGPKKRKKNFQPIDFDEETEY